MILIIGEVQLKLSDLTKNDEILTQVRLTLLSGKPFKQRTKDYLGNNPIINETVVFNIQPGILQKIL